MAVTGLALPEGQGREGVGLELGGVLSSVAFGVAGDEAPAPWGTVTCTREADRKGFTCEVLVDGVPVARLKVKRMSVCESALESTLTLTFDGDSVEASSL